MRYNPFVNKSSTEFISINEVGVLIIAYNRPNLLLNRVREISNLVIPNLYISIDGGVESHTHEMLEAIKSSQEILSGHGLKIFHYGENIGMAKHVTDTISYILKLHDYIIVIEDNVTLSENFVRNMIMGLSLQKSFKMYGLVSGNSHLYSHVFNNKWRATPIPSIWGWACHYKTWEGYKLDLSGYNLKFELDNSQLWKSMSSYHKKVLLSKFTKSLQDSNYNWDSQLIFQLLRKNLCSISPIFSISGNEGFGNSKSVHTSYRKPKYIQNLKLNNRKIYKLSKYSFFYIWYDFTGIKHRIKLLIRKYVAKHKDHR